MIICWYMLKHLGCICTSDWKYLDYIGTTVYSSSQEPNEDNGLIAFVVLNDNSSLRNDKETHTSFASVK